MLKTLTTAPCGVRVTSCAKTVLAPIAVAVGRVTSWSSTDTAELTSQVSPASFPTLPILNVFHRNHAQSDILFSSLSTIVTDTM